MDNYQQIHQSASKVLPVAVEMEELFGSADHFITHFGLRSQKTNTWNTDVFFGGRYELSMQVEVVVHYGENRIEVVGEPQFFLVETVRVDVSDEGRVSGRYGRNFRLSKDEWKKVYEARGDFGVIGIELNTEPVKNFDQAVAAERNPLIPIRLMKE